MEGCRLGRVGNVDLVKICCKKKLSKLIKIRKTKKVNFLFSDVFTVLHFTLILYMCVLYECIHMYKILYIFMFIQEG